MSLQIVDTATEMKLLEARKGRIGSSDITSVCGLNPWKTPLQFALEFQGKVDRQPETRAMRLGKKMQPIVAAEYLEEKAVEIRPNTHSYIHANHWAMATPDYWIEDSGILECKTTSSYGKKDWELSVPDYSHCQVQWQMGITEAPHCDVACLIGNRDLVIHRVEYSKDVFEQLLEMAQKFLDMIARGELPAPRAEDLDTIKKALKHDGDACPVLGERAKTQLDDYLIARSERDILRAQLNKVETTMKAGEAFLRMQMKDASRAICGDMELILTPWHRKEHMVKASNGYKFSIKKDGEDGHD